MPDSFRDLQSFYGSTLSQSIGASDTTIPVATAPTITSGYFIIEPGTANEEIVLLTGVSGNNLTVTRGLSSSGSSESAGTGLAHSSGVPIVNADAHFYIKKIQISKAFEYRGSYNGVAAINAITNATLGDVAIDYTTGNTYWYNGSAWAITSGGSAPADASTVVKGITKMSVTPAIAASPIAVGDNDPRMLTAAQALANAGDDTSIAVGSGNRFVTQTGLQNQSEIISTLSGTNTITATYAPAPTALVKGQEFWGVIAVTNTGAVTFNPNGLGAKAVKKLDGATALVAGDLVAGQWVGFKYDGTNFQLITPAVTSLPLLSSPSLSATQSSGSISSLAATVAVPAGAHFGVVNAILSTSDNNGSAHANTFQFTILAVAAGNTTAGAAFNNGVTTDNCTITCSISGSTLTVTMASATCATNTHSYTISGTVNWY